jgi:hypothetical protein
VARQHAISLLGDGVDELRSDRSQRGTIQALNIL